MDNMKKVYPESKITGPSMKRSSSNARRQKFRQSFIKRGMVSIGNRDILKRYQKIKLETDQLVEFVKDKLKPKSKILCQIMVITDHDPPTYNLRWCTDDEVETNIFENCSETTEVEVFRNGGIKRETLNLIVPYKQLKEGQQMQVLRNEHWFNCTILSVSRSELLGVLYEVQLISSKSDKRTPVPLQDVKYDQIRHKPKPEYKVNDLVELRIHNTKSKHSSDNNEDNNDTQDTSSPIRDNPFFPAVILKVLDNSPVPGGMAYNVEYYSSGTISKGKAKKRTVTPMVLRHRFATGNSKLKGFAEYFQVEDNEGWLKCSIGQANSDGTYMVNVDDGVAETVTAYAKDLRLYLGVGENAMRKSDGRPVTIVSQDALDVLGHSGSFTADVHFENEIKRQLLKRSDLQRITLEELRNHGVENDQEDQNIDLAVRNEILEQIQEIIEEKNNGPFVTTCHGIDLSTGISINHKHNVFALTYSHNGAFFVTGDVGGTVMLYDGNTGHMMNSEFYKYEGRHNAWIVNLSFSKNNDMLAICFLSGVVILQVEVQDGAMIRRGNHPIVTPDTHEGGCLSCDFSHKDNNLLATGSFDGQVIIWRVLHSTTQNVGNINVRPLSDAAGFESPSLSMVKFCPMGTRLAAAAGDGHCYIYTLDMKENGMVSVKSERQILANGHSDEITCLVFSHGKGNFLATGGRDNVAVVWSTRNGDMLARLTNGHVRDITSVDFDPSNKFVVTASDDCRIIFWDTITAEKVGLLVGEHTSGVNRIAFQPHHHDRKSTALVSVGNDERVLLWKPGGLRWSRTVKADVSNRPAHKPRKDFKAIKSIACHPCENWLIFSESCDGRVMSQSLSINKGEHATQSLAKMDGSPVFCQYDAFKRCCTKAAPKGASEEELKTTYKASGRMKFSNFASGKYKNGWTCNGVPNEANDFKTCKNKFHPPGEMRFFCMPCGFNLCLQCSGVYGHSMNVNSIDISTDGKFACSVADDSTCIVWNMSRLYPVESDVQSKKPKDSFEVRPYYKGKDGKNCVMASSFNFHVQGATSVRIAPSDLHFVTSSKNEFRSAVWEFDREIPNPVPLYLLEGGISADFVDRDSVVTASKHMLRLYDLKISVMTGKADFVYADIFEGAEKGKPLDLTDKYKDVAKKICVSKKMGKLGSLTTLAVCHKIFKNFCAVGDSFGNVSLLGLGIESNRDIYALEGANWRHHQDQITCMAFSANGHNLATGSRDMTVRVYSIQVLTSKENINKIGVRNVKVEACFMTPGGSNPFPKVDMIPDLPVQDPDDVEFIGHMAAVSSLTFSSTGSQVYSGDEAGHIIHWWWKADPHVDFCIAAFSKQNAGKCVTDWIDILAANFGFSRIGFDTDLALCNIVDVDHGVQLLTMLMSRGCFAGTQHETLFKSLFYQKDYNDEDDEEEEDHAAKNSFLAGAIAGGTNSTDFMSPANNFEGAASPLEMVFASKEVMDSRVYNLKYGTTMLKYWLAMGRSCMQSDITTETPELLVNFLLISAAVAKVLPTIAKYKIELAKDILHNWSHGGLSLVTNPYAALLMAQDGPHKFNKLFANASGVDCAILDILPDSSETPYGESLLCVDEKGFELNETAVTGVPKYKLAGPNDKSIFRTEQFRFKVSSKVQAGFVPVIPSVFSFPFVSDRIEDSLLHILASEEELFDCVFDEKADTEFKASPGLSILVNFKWRQYARKEYLARFYTFAVQYICYLFFSTGLVFERQYFEHPPCNVFSESSVRGEWDSVLAEPNCSHFSISFAAMLNNTVRELDPSTYYSNLGNLILYFIMAVITLCFSIYHLIMMVVQNRAQSCAEVFGSSINANYLDFATYVMMAATVSLFFARSVQAGAVGSVTSVLAAWKFMLSLRGFAFTSHYIRTIIEITRFSGIFLFIMIFFSIGCGWAFMLLFGGWKEEHLQKLGIEFEGADGANQYELFQTVWRTVVTSWDFMVGNTDIEAWLDSYYELIAIPLFFFFSFMVVLVMLNLVIALMADGYTEVMETKSKAKIKERANIIVGIEKTFNSSVFSTDKNKFPVWIHALMKENSDGTPIGDMPASFNDQVNENLTSLKESLEELKEEREVDKASLKQIKECMDQLMSIHKKQ